MYNYILWCRRKNDPDALWQFMPYARRSKAECLQLMEYYLQEWGHMYEYEIHKAGRFGTRPQGMCVPAYPGVAD